MSNLEPSSFRKFELAAQRGNVVPVVRTIPAASHTPIEAFGRLATDAKYGFLLERGVRTFAQHTRNTLDFAAIPAVRLISHLPIVIDPSHGTGKNYMVASMARAGVAAGADGLLIETHDQPERALCDSTQALTLKQYEVLVREVRAIHETMLSMTAVAVE